MLICIECREALPPSGQCSNCGFAVLKKAGVDCYAEELMYNAGGFKAEYFAELFRLEAGHFWFEARNQLILKFLAQYCGDFNSLLEIGCGTGFVLSGINRQFPKIRVVGSEIHITGLEHASKRVPNATFLQMDARQNPYQKEFDVIGAFDVLEHIEEDVEVMKQVNDALRAGGYFLLTVPQHQWLWSQVDEHAHHVRRYSKVELHEKLAATGFKVVRSSSFVSTLLPAMIASRLISKRIPVKAFDPLSEFNISPLLNYLLWRVLTLEVSLVSLGISLPMGGSRIVLAQKI
jgi:SAM-dependent methyltransferase